MVNPGDSWWWTTDFLFAQEVELTKPTDLLISLTEPGEVLVMGRTGLEYNIPIMNQKHLIKLPKPEPVMIVFSTKRIEKIEKLPLKYDRRTI